MMAQNAVAGATAPASGAGIGCWSFQTPGPVSSRSSGGKADGGLPSRSGIATGTGPRGRRTQSLPAACRGVPPTPVCSGVQIPELLPSPVLQRSSACCQATPAPARIPSAHFERRSLLLLNSAAFSLSASTRFTITCTCAGVRPGASRSAPGASAAPALSGSPSLARAQLCRSGASSLAQLQSHGRHMDATTNILALHYHRISS